MAKKNTKKTEAIDDNESIVKRFLIILIIIIIVVVGIYFLTTLVNNENKVTDDPIVEGSVNYSLVNVGMILNRPYDDYYVLVYDKEDQDSIYYSSLFTKYDSLENKKKIYFCDLGNPLNKEYVATDEKPVNKDANKIDEFSFGEITLLEIKNGKIVKYLDNLDEIKKALQ